MKVGVLALQGDVPEHVAAVARVLPAGDVSMVHTPADLEAVDALTMPGGESTTIASLLEKSGLWDPLAVRMKEGMPVLATCAGLILLAKHLEAIPSGKNPRTFGVLDVTVRRNDYGNQIASFEGPVHVAGLNGPYPGVFIRAPRILSVGKGAEPVARRGPEIVGAQSGALVGLSFHPELTQDPRLYAWFMHEVVGPAYRK
jgi:pyridoxal 5'-phosphate synthase pdxT subunit